MLGVHDQVDGATTGITDVTAVAVAGGGEGKRGMGVVVKRAEALVTLYGEAESRSYGLDGKILEFLNFEFVKHIFVIMSPIQGRLNNKPYM